MRVTRRESKREEKRTGSGSIRRTSERDRETEGDRGSGGVSRLEGTRRCRRGDIQARERREGWKHKKDEEGQSIAHSQVPASAT